MVSGPGLDSGRQLTCSQEPRPRGYVPLDLLTGAYLVLSILLLIIGWRRIPNGGGLLLIHVGLFLAVMMLGTAPRPTSLSLRFLRDTYALWGLPLIYRDVGLLSRIFHESLHDSVVLRWEHRIFGLFPSVWLPIWVPGAALSDFLHLFYLASFALAPALAVSLYLEGREELCRIFSFTVVLTMVTSYAVTVAFPVAGPFYVFLREGPGDGVVARIVRGVLAATASRGTSFPSSHVAGMTAAILIACRADRRLLPFLVIAGTTALFAVIYCGFHHGVDVLAGLVLGVVGALVGPRVYRALLRQTRLTPPRLHVMERGAGDSSSDLPTPSSSDHPPLF